MRDVLLTLLFVPLLAGCDSHGQGDAGKPQATAPPVSAIETLALETIAGVRTLEGVAAIESPDGLLQLDGDLRAARIAADYSSAQLARYRATPALARQTVENAARQAETDAAHLDLLKTRLRQSWGEDAPVLDDAKRLDLLGQIAAGTTVIARLDFPENPGPAPGNVRVRPLAGDKDVAVTTLWIAPSGNQSMPGTSYYALLPAGPGLRPGDRARVLADNGRAQGGVLIPHSAIVVHESQAWCYVANPAGGYRRQVVPLDRPMPDGYLVTSGFEAGTRVVVRGASTLLAREAAPEEGDDDEAPRAKPAAKDDDVKPAAPPAAGAMGDKDDDDEEDDHKRAKTTEPAADPPETGAVAVKPAPAPDDHD